MSDSISRRQLLKTGSMIAVGLATPSWLSSIAKADVLRSASGKGVDPDGILVVCEFKGGNDGLNMIVPYADDNYYRLRPTLGIPRESVLHITDQMGLHPNMAGLSELYKEGKVAVVQNVGYPKPNRSHFKSMDIWHAASPDTSLKYGWIGRHLDHLAEDHPLNSVYALGLSNEKPGALNANKVSVPCFGSLADIQSMVGNADAERMLREISANAHTDDEKLVAAANKSAFDAMVALKEQLGGFSPSQTYGNDKFGQGFKQISQLIATSQQTRVVYFSNSGFDTHARQADTQAGLLKGFSDGILAFQREMEAIGKAKKVVVVVFSEFGRRTYENNSGGTDHGAAAPMLVIGNNVKGGFYGPIPNFNDLNDGDLKFAIDFRQVYATALDEWMGGDSELILGGKFDSLPVFKR